MMPPGAMRGRNQSMAAASTGTDRAIRKGKFPPANGLAVVGKNQAPTNIDAAGALEAGAFRVCRVPPTYAHFAIAPTR